MLNIIKTVLNMDVARFQRSGSIVTGLIDKDGNSVDPYEFTWTDFEAKNSADYTGITIRITDRHQDSRGVGGILIDGGTSWVLQSKCIYYATLAAAPSPVTYPGLRIFAANIGLNGTYMTSDGAHYRSDAPYITLANNLSLVSRSIGASPNINEEWQPFPIRLRRDINNECVMQDGDYLSIHNAWIEKTGTADALNVQVRFGTGNNTSDASLLSSAATASASNTQRVIKFMEIVRISNVAVNLRGAQTINFAQGPLALNRASDITVPNMDSTSDSYLNIGMYIAALTDTALGLREYEVRLVKGY